MSSEQDRIEFETINSMVESLNKSTNEKFNKVKSTDSSGTSQNEPKNSPNSQLNQNAFHSPTKSSNNNLINQPTLSNVKSTSRENLDTSLHQNHHQSHNNLSNLTSSSIVDTNQNLNALDLPASRDTYKNRKKIYQQEKKKLAEQLLSTLNDPTLIILADYLKVRTTFKAWTKLWCQVRPGLLVVYKSPKVYKSGQWIGTVLLNITNVIERPSKKGGFCFKLFGQTEHSIWAKQGGPRNETFGAITIPLPLTYLMCRCPSQQTGSRWIKAIELSIQSSKQMILNDSNLKFDKNRLLDEEDINTLKDEHEIEREHFIDQDLTDDNNSSAEHEYHDRSTDTDTTNSSNDYATRTLTKKPLDDRTDDKSDKTQQFTTTTKKLRKGQTNELSSQSSQQADKKSDQLITLTNDIESPIDQTEYIYQPEGRFGFDEHSQTEEVGEENKSLLWSLLKQVRPGDLSKVVLPTFILEPRSFLEKLTDYYYHCDILAKATIENDPFERMKQVVRWYLSGFYKKPNGLKKPYNPILKETFRCYWEHLPVNETNSDTNQDSSQLTKTFYIAEQISHHPPCSAFYCVNRNQGYLLNGAVQVSSSYYGNSVSAILHGNVRLSLINRGEDYLMNMPYAHCKGILFGGLSFELAGKVEIKCERTNYSCDMEFKLKPFLGGEMNVVSGKIKLGNETLATLEGYWDSKIKIKEKRTGKVSYLWQANSDAFNQRLKRYVVPLDKQTDFESQKLWQKVSEAILKGDQKQATVEKTKLEERQRREAKHRQENNIKHQPRLFVLDPLTNEWRYKYEDMRPWDPYTDIVQFEKSFIIQTLTKHRTISKASLTNLNSSISNCSPVLGSMMIGGKSTYSNLINLTPPQHKTPILRKRSPKTRAKTKSSSPIEIKKLNDDFLLEQLSSQNSKKCDVNKKLFADNSIDGDEEDELTDCDSFKNNPSSSSKKSSHFTNQLIKRIEQNESELKRNLINLKNRQQKLEQIVLDERSNSRLSFWRRLINLNSHNFFSLPNMITILILTVIIQLMIYKFNNSNYLRK